MVVKNNKNNKSNNIDDKDLIIEILVQALKNSIISNKFKNEYLSLLLESFDSKKLDKIYDSKEFNEINKKYKIKQRKNINDQRAAIECKIILDNIGNNIRLDTSELSDLLGLWYPQVESVLEKIVF